MEPFVADRAEHFSAAHNTAAPAKETGTRRLVVLVAVISVIVLSMSAVLIALTLIQQQRFDSLQQNYLQLQANLAKGATPAPAAAPPVAEAPPATEAIQSQPASDPEALAALQDELQQVRQDVANLGGKLGDLENTVKAIKVPANGSASTFNSKANSLSQEMASLRREVLDLKLGQEDLQNQPRAWQTEYTGRITSLEMAVMSLNDFRQQTESSPGSQQNLDAVINKIHADIRLLKKQHPYLEED